MEDPQKIRDKIIQLKTSTGQNWIELKGNYALTKVEVKKEGLEFKPSIGIISKVFFNHNTGEMRVFSAEIFEEDKENNIK